MYELVQNIMIKDVYTVSPDTSIVSAMKLLLEKKISGLPVVDDDNKLLGILTEKDMLDILFDEAVQKKDVIKERKASDYMNTDVKSVASTDSVISVCEAFIREAVRRFPVVDEGRLVGIVARRDIIRLILDKIS